VSSPQLPDRSRRVLVPTLITLAALVLGGSIFTGVWTERLWFRSVDYGSVFSTMLVTRALLFVVFGLFFAGVVAVNAWLAWRMRPDYVVFRRNDPASRYRQVLEPIGRLALLGVALVLTVLTGGVAAGHWKTYQLWRHGGSFGLTDPHFHKDVGFYVFDYPWLRYLASYGFAVIVVSVLAALFVHYIYGAIAQAGRGLRFSRAAQVQLAVLVGIGVLIKAFSYYLDRFGLAVTTSSLFDGIGYTDAHARIPSRNILIVVAVVCAILLFSVVVLRSWRLPILGLGLMALSSVLIGGIWPYAMQSFQVKPSEPDKEGPYIAKNIAATRTAFGVSGAKVVKYSASTTLSAKELSESAAQRVSSRLLDPTLISDAFEQLQQVRGYYTVQTTLDVDRYQLDGNPKPQDVIIAARELNLDGLQPSQRNWANDHTVYTHGYGVIAARGNKRGDQGEPVWVVKDIPPKGDILTDNAPRIYFGEKSPTYSIVGRPAGAPPVEVDIPKGESGDKSASQNTYDGTGGVQIGSMVNRFLYAVKFAEPNIVLSSRVNGESRILYDRNPRQRVEKVAPWLTVDGDQYPAVVDGRLVWIVDGYTTSNTYPYSEHVSLQEAASDTLTRTAAQAALPTDDVDYMRNSVKAVVDAYDGSVDLYTWDEKDPVLKAWKGAFPGTVKPKSAISKGLKAHLRYPEDMFKVQREILARYHVTDAQTFYGGGERWRVPSDPNNAATLQPPYYLTMARLGENDPRFSLTSVFLPNSRQNLSAFVSVDSEATDPEYGQMQILQVPSGKQISGPNQIANDFQTDKGVTQALLQFEQAKEARILHGNLLTLPVGNALLYVQPVYIQRSNAEGTFPVLQFVAASFGGQVGFGTTLDDALRGSLGLSKSEAPSESQPSKAGTAKRSTSQWLEAAATAYNAAQSSLKDGDLAGYQKHVDEMNDALHAAQGALP
jgi:uncharacterized membrane protein (UPF0182 family)